MILTVACQLPDRALSPRLVCRQAGEVRGSQTEGLDLQGADLVNVDLAELDLTQEQRLAGYEDELVYRFLPSWTLCSMGLHCLYHGERAVS